MLYKINYHTVLYRSWSFCVFKVNSCRQLERGQGGVGQGAGGDALISYCIILHIYTLNILFIFLRAGSWNGGKAVSVKEQAVTH